jgi:hypothetical protein
VLLIYQTIALVPATDAGPQNKSPWKQQPLNPEVFTRPFPVSAQQFLALPDRQPPRAVDAQGFPREWSRQSKQPYPAAQQQWSSFQPAGFIQSTFPDGWRHEEWSVELRPLYPIALQPYTTTPNPQEVLPSAPLQGRRQLDDAKLSEVRILV